MDKIVTLIPARGGSKGIPRKNLLDIHGRPMIYYTIKASLNSIVDETWVSSEDEEILKISESYNAYTIKRPDELSTDNSSSESVLFHFAENVDFDILVFVQATSPLIISDDLNKGIEMMRNYDSVLSVTTCLPFIWMANGTAKYDYNHRKRRQELENLYLETGGFFITTRKNLDKFKNRIGGRIGLCIVPKIRSFDVDTHEDLEIVKKLLKTT